MMIINIWNTRWYVRTIFDNYFFFQALVTKVKDAADKGLDHITISEVNGDQKFLLKVNKLIKWNPILIC